MSKMWKYKNKNCRYNFGQFFTERTIVSLPLPNHLPDPPNYKILNERERILLMMKNYIEAHLDPVKRKYTPST